MKSLSYIVGSLLVCPLALGTPEVHDLEESNHRTYFNISESKRQTLSDLAIDFVNDLYQKEIELSSLNYDTIDLVLREFLDSYEQKSLEEELQATVESTLEDELASSENTQDPNESRKKILFLSKLRFLLDKRKNFVPEETPEEPTIEKSSSLDPAPISKQGIPKTPGLDPAKKIESTSTSPPPTQNVPYPGDLLPGPSNNPTIPRDSNTIFTDNFFEEPFKKQPSVYRADPPLTASQPPLEKGEEIVLQEPNKISPAVSSQSQEEDLNTFLQQFPVLTGYAALEEPQEEKVQLERFIVPLTLPALSQDWDNNLAYNAEEFFADEEELETEETPSRETKQLSDLERFRLTLR